jgi:hypothetical protein
LRWIILMFRIFFIKCLSYLCIIHMHNITFSSISGLEICLFIIFWAFWWFNILVTSFLIRIRVEKVIFQFTKCIYTYFILIIFSGFELIIIFLGWKGKHILSKIIVIFLIMLIFSLIIFWLRLILTRLIEFFKTMIIYFIS